MKVERAKADAHWKLQSNKNRGAIVIFVCETVGQVVLTLWRPNVLIRIVTHEVIYIYKA